jgi:outer membrane protein assembly factor BamB
LLPNDPLSGRNDPAELDQTCRAFDTGRIDLNGSAAMSRFLCATILLLTLFATGGCQLFQPAVDNSGPIIDAFEARSIGYGPPRWAQDLGLEDSDRLSHAAVLDDVIMCVDLPSNIVSCISVRDGSIRWQKQPAEDTDLLFEPVRLDADQIMVNSETRIYYLDAKSGRTLARSKLEASVGDRPAVIGRNAVFGGLNGRVFAHDADRGMSVWSQQMSAGINVRPVTVGFNVLVTDSNGVYGMYESVHGENLWKGQTYGQISAVPAVSGDGLFVVSADQSMYALNRSNGDNPWKYIAPTPVTSAPIVLGGMVFLSVPDKGLIAFNAITGEELWVKDTTARPIKIVKQRLILNDETRLITVAPDSGQTIAEVAVKRLKSVLSGPGDSLILVTADGRLTRINALR